VEVRKPAGTIEGIVADRRTVEHDRDGISGSGRRRVHLEAYLRLVDIRAADWGRSWGEGCRSRLADVCDALGHWSLRLTNEV
jgi:hypothetical protein